jgi:hypothetical protein
MRACLTLACVAFLCVSACGNDFDALFADGAGSTDGGPTDPDPKKDGGGGAKSCGPPVACSPDEQCTGSDCTYACRGCDCTCPAFDCPKSGGVNRCVSECSPGTTCDVKCDVADCQLTAHGATAKLDCQDEDCTVTCDQGASCDIRCAGDSDCAVTCNGADTACLLRCTSAPDSCVLTCGGGGKHQQCPGGIQTCNRACPN